MFRRKYSGNRIAYSRSQVLSQDIYSARQNQEGMNLIRQGTMEDGSGIDSTKLHFGQKLFGQILSLRVWTNIQPNTFIIICVKWLICKLVF
jgi:hypothetical protein